MTSRSLSRSPEAISSRILARRALWVTPTLRPGLQQLDDHGLDVLPHADDAAPGELFREVAAQLERGDKADIGKR
jgi:hypothetical protein